uniref:Uncharacterized protein n=1 Tax=Romanomermis culicivorax TaxID=13658 RepID=A0A915L4K5_ROMCU
MVMCVSGCRRLPLLGVKRNNINRSERDSPTTHQKWIILGLLFFYCLFDPYIFMDDLFWAIDCKVFLEYCSFMPMSPNSAMKIVQYFTTINPWVSRTLMSFFPLVPASAPFITAFIIKPYKKKAQHPNSARPSNAAIIGSGHCYFCRMRVHPTDGCNRPCPRYPQIHVHRAMAYPHSNPMMP